MKISLLAFFISFYTCYSQVKTDYHLLWQITKPNSTKTSYIFGSMHSNLPEVFQFPDSLYTALMHTDMLAVETDVIALFDTYDVRLEPFGMELFSKERDLTSTRKASTTVYGNEDGRPQFLDAYLQQTAHCLEKPVFAMESMEEQIQISKKINTSARAKVNAALYSEEAVTKAYIDGDIETLYRMLQAQYKNMDDAFNELIVKRNKRMVAKLDSLMENNTLLFVVGAGHLSGEQGILKLLMNQGYLIKHVPFSQSDLPSTEKKQCLLAKNILFQNLAYQFEIILPGKAYVCESNKEINVIYQELGQGNTYHVSVYPISAVISEFEKLFEEKSSILKGTNHQGITYVEGIQNDLIHGPEWKRYYVKNGFCYELSCYGGNKFMHSNRPKNFFDRLVIN